MKRTKDLLSNKVKWIKHGRSSQSSAAQGPWLKCQRDNKQRQHKDNGQHSLSIKLNQNNR